MKKVIYLIIATLFLTCFPTTHIFAAELNNQPLYEENTNPPTAENLQELLSKRKPAASSQEKQSIKLSEVRDREIVVKGKLNLKEINGLGLTFIESTNLAASDSLLYTFKISKELDFENTLQKVTELEGVEKAEPNYKIESAAVLNDPLYKEQWHLPALDLPQAWDLVQSRKEVKVAVLDTGVNKNHPDLAGKILNGYDFINDDADPNDDNGHGTRVAGVIAAVANNKKGVVGVNQNVKIIPVKISNRTGHSTIGDSVKGINYAIEQGANIINMSYGNYRYSDLENEALWDAYNHDITLIAAAGNDGTSEEMYPASYSPVISVAATNQSKALASFSNKGDWIDVSAPGERIYTTLSNGGYGSTSGTSFSAPIVSGIASLLLNQNPDLTPMEVEWALQLGTNTGKWERHKGYGIVNALNSLNVKFPSLDNDISDDEEQAYELQFNKPYIEKIDHPYDYDVYHVKVNSNSQLRLIVDQFSPELDINIQLAKVENGQFQLIDIIDENGHGVAEDYSLFASQGDYYFILSDYYDHWSTKPYRINVVLQREDVVIQSPKPNVLSGKYNKPFNLELKAESTSKMIKYTLDGSTPSSSNGYEYKEPIPVYESTTVKAIAIAGALESEVVTFSYEIDPLTIPNVSSLKGFNKYPVARVIIRQDDLVMYKKNSDNSFTKYRTLSKQEQVKVFGVSGYYYNVGGPFFIKHEEGKTISYIGRALIKAPTALYDPDGNVYETVQKGEALKVYSYNDQVYDVGGGYTIHNDNNTFFLIGYIKPKKDITMYDAQGRKFSTLKKNNLYYVKAIEDGKVDLGNGYYALDRKEDFNFIKN
ncbi:S8 family serine peptidase [Metabacillus fastidiosus]|uniref:S8 family serine peptidase n=1 Tax=Metabacillus fastidiosus TaxID=1458 RepID=UPI002DBEB51B|nr:S8 family serine peptidase [Metabacillus fastidiosus]MEC2077852.1 S8 family serine peptidase [Metabacillus fastidiosus]